MGSDFEQDAELLEIFLEESHEQLDGIEADLLAIEAAGADIDEELVNKTFRAVHSVKGGAGFFFLEGIQRLAHAMENVLGMVRGGQLVPDNANMSTLLVGADYLGRMLDDLDAAKDASSVAGLIAEIEASAGGAAPARPEPQPEAQPEPKASRGGLQFSDPEAGVIFDLSAAELEAASHGAPAGAEPYLICFDAVSDEPGFIDERFELFEALFTVLAGRVGAPSVEGLTSPLSQVRLPVYLAVLATDPPEVLAEATELPVSAIRPMGAPAAAAPPPAPPSPTAPAAPASAAPAARPSAQAKDKDAGSIRVRLSLLDKLMTLAGELVLTRNQLLQSVDGSAPPVVDASHRIDHITTELQDAIMSTRMQSVGIVFNKFRRVVRDLAKGLGKQVDLVIEGEDVELDKTVIETISDPLTHLVRNALDHGLETPDVREAAGKPARGLLRLSASHRAGNVIIEIQDDGRGIDVDRIKAKALERGLHSADELAIMSKQSALRLIMRPGFSTAEKVTDISGRGVGMDVVASNLKKLGGSIDLDSELGGGTTMRVKLPLTLAIIPALLITEEARRFAIPQANLLELHRIPARDIARRIRLLGDSEVLTLRGELLPVLRLRHVLGMSSQTFLDEEGRRRPDRRTTIGDHRHPPGESNRRQSVSSAVHVAVVGAGDLTYGLVLESWQETSEIVVKPLGKHLRDCEAYAGATILGDGSSALILDVEGIARRIHGDVGGDDAELDARAAVAGSDPGLSTLLLRGFGDDLFSIPLELVTRVERTQPARLQRVMGQVSLRYHGGSLPLVLVDELVGKSPRLDRPGYVAVFEHFGHEVGIYTADLLDVVDVGSRVDDVAMRSDGLLGSFHLADELVLLLDVQRLAADALREVAIEPPTAVIDPRAVVLVEPKGFLRRSLVRAIRDLGLEVHAVATLDEALDLGVERAAWLIELDSQRARYIEQIAELRAGPMHEASVVGLSNRPTQALEAAAREARIDRFATRVDRQDVLRALRAALGTNAGTKKAG